MLLTGYLLLIPANYMLNVGGLALIGGTLASQILFKKQKAVVFEE